MSRIRSLVQQSITLLLAIASTTGCREATPTQHKETYFRSTITRVEAYQLRVQGAGAATNKEPTTHTFYKVTLHREDGETETCWYGGFEPLSVGSTVVYRRAPFDPSIQDLGAIVPLAEGYECRVLDAPPPKLPCAYEDLHQITPHPERRSEKQRRVPEIFEKLLTLHP